MPTFSPLGRLFRMVLIGLPIGLTCLLLREYQTLRRWARIISGRRDEIEPIGNARAPATWPADDGRATPTASARRRWLRPTSGSAASDRCNHKPARPPETSPVRRPRHP